MDKERAMGSVFLDSPQHSRIHAEIADEVMTPQKELNLVKKSIGGCDDSFGQLYEIHNRRVYRHLYYMIGNSETAEDLASTTFLKAYEAIGRYKITGAPFHSWLLRIAHNLGVSELRSRRQTTELHEGIVAKGQFENEVIDGLERDRKKIIIHEAISRLKPVRANVIRMRFLEEEPYINVSETIGETVSNARVIQHRALNDLRRLNWDNLDDETFNSEGVA